MSGATSLPLWLLGLLSLSLLLGLWLVLIAPLLSRWFYRQSGRSARRLDERLEFGISDYALAGRTEWLQRLLDDTVVQRTISEIAAETGELPATLRRRAQRDAREIVPFFNALLYFRLGYWLARWCLRTLYWVDAEFTDRDALGKIPRDSCVVLVSNHRSNLDPFILIYLASRRAAISYSAGEWARAWPFHYLLHAIGFYIIRRDGSGDRLYRTLVQRYVYLAASRCVPQGLFLEGGLSRDGRMLPLKLGLLSYLLTAQGRENCRDIVFVPVGLSYDRIPEDKTLLANKTQGFRDKGNWYATLSFLRFMLLLMPRMTGLTKPYGRVVANFGTPFSLAQWQLDTGETLAAENPDLRRAAVTRLGESLRAEIERLVPILPISLLSAVLLRAGAGGIPEQQLKQDALALATALSGAGAPVMLPIDREEREFVDAIYQLSKRRFIDFGAGGRLCVADRGRSMLEYYRNAIEPWVVV
jgi:glycerol-3-phosphate O-acyltransferase